MWKVSRLVVLFFFCFFSKFRAATITWVGSTSTSMSTAANWSPATLPSSSDDVIINSGATNQPTLNAATTYSSLTLNGGTLTLNSVTLTAATVSINGGTLMGVAQATSILQSANFNTLQNAIIDKCLIIKTFLAGGIDNVSAGGLTIAPTFNVVIRNLDDNNWRFEGNNVMGGSSTNTVTGLTVSSSGRILFSYNGTNTCSNKIAITSNGTGGISFGEGGGTTVLTNTTSNGHFITTGFINGPLIFNNVTQNGTTANQTFASPSSFKCTNSSFRSALVVSSPTITNIQNSTFHGTLTLTKLTGGLSSVCEGGNVFNNDVTITNNDGSLTLANTSSDDYNGNVTYSITSASASISPAYNGDNTYSKNITLSGNSVATSFGSGSGRVVIDGTISQSITADASFPPTFNNLLITNSNGLDLASADLNISGIATFSSGKITSSAAKYLIFTAGSSCTGYGNSSFAALSVKKVGNTAFTFPIGISSVYAPISISAPSLVTDVFLASYFNSSPHPTYNGNSLASSLNHVSGCEYWVLDRIAGASNVNVTLTWDTRSCGVNSISDLRVAHWNGTTWTDEGAISATGSNSVGSITSQTVSSFSPFALASANTFNPLPVELVDFRVELVDEAKAQLSWLTQSESNNDRFEIERSKDGVNWFKVGEVKGHGNSAVTLNYEYLDKSILRGFSYYRLVQFDYNGHFKISDVKMINNNVSNHLTLYPNPCVNTLKIEGFENSDDEINVNIINAIGEDSPVMKKYSFDEGIDVSNLNAGKYIIRVISKNKIEYLSFIKI